MDSTTITDSPALATPAEPPPPPFSSVIRLCLSSPFLIPALVLLAGLGLSLFALWPTLPTLWGATDGYYSHGPLVPLISGYIVYRRWPYIRETPVRPGWFALPFLIPIFFLMRAGNQAQIMSVLSLCLIGTLLIGIWFVAGWRWLLALAPPVLYLVFGLPVWTMAFDTYTNPLQLLSTKVAYELLKVTGFSPWMTDNTTIYVNAYTLDVAVPCSGMRLLLALITFTVFFALVARLRWWGNVVLAAFVVPLCLFINGLRIALIGVVGDLRGADAAHKFHDYSGYITLVLCFFILFRVARVLGWKD